MIEHRLILALVAVYNRLVLALVSFVVTLLIAANSFFGKVRMSHENGIALRGRLRIAADPRMPQHDFFEQGRTFACRIRHGAASFTDDAKLVVRSGEAVRGGARIGFTGGSGADARLHFELRRDNEPRDPLPLLPARF